MHPTARHNHPEPEMTTASRDKAPDSKVRAMILFVEPEPQRAAGRSLFLQAAGYTVVPVEDTRELQTLSGMVGASLVIVSEGFERSKLQQLTVAARRKWPAARILILGRAQSILDDHLYDDALEEPFKPMLLLEAVAHLLSDRWSERRRTTPAADIHSETAFRTSVLHLVTPAQNDPAMSQPAESAYLASAWNTAVGERIGPNSIGSLQAHHDLPSAEKILDGPDHATKRWQRK